MHKAYALILLQCNKGLKKKLQEIKYREANIKNQTIGILKEIEEITHNYQDS